MYKVVILLAALLIGVGAQANLAISVTGTADSSGLGYTSGQSYTFTWAINEAYTGSNSDSFDSNRNSWEGNLWSAVSGDGISGSEPNDFQQLSVTSDGVRMHNGVYSWNTTVDGKVILYEDASLPIPGMDFSSETYISPVDYFADYAGTYDVTGGKMEISTDEVFDSSGLLYERELISFSLNSATIEVIPEPSSVLLIAVISGFGLFVRRRFPCV